MQRWEAVCGRSEEWLRTLPENSVAAVVSDPPYGLSDDCDIAKVLTAWLAGESYVHPGKGFMNREWDSFVPGPEFWRESYRVLKPGGHVAACISTRTWDLLSIALRLAGFENRDTIRTEYGPGVLGPPGGAWGYSQGVPKGPDIAANVDKLLGVRGEVVEYYLGDNDLMQARGADRNKMRPRYAISSEQAQRWVGWSTTLKPAWEPILIFRKPVTAKSIAANVLEWEVGAINIDGCRFKRLGADLSGWAETGSPDTGGLNGAGGAFSLRRDRPAEEIVQRSALGRFPTNVWLCHAHECKLIGTILIPAHELNVASEEGSKPLDGTEDMEEVDVWDCVHGCPVGDLERKHGKSRGRIGKRWETPITRTYGVKNRPAGPKIGIGDFGSVARFFYQAKPSSWERDAGCEALYWAVNDDSPSGFVQIDREEWEELGRREAEALAREEKIFLRAQGNIHATVKPAALMEYLIRMLVPPGETVIDPCAGSFTTGVAAMRVKGVLFKGCDAIPDYVRIGEHRLRYEEAHPGGKKEPKPKPLQPSMHSLMFGEEEPGPEPEPIQHVEDLVVEPEPVVMLEYTPAAAPDPEPTPVIPSGGKLVATLDLEWD